MRSFLSIAAAVFVFANAAPADIYQWEYINPADPSQGKRQSTTLAPDGAGVDAVPGAALSGRNLTMAYLVGADLTRAFGFFPNLTNADLSQANLSNTYFLAATFTNADLSHANLTNAALRGANLHDALFIGANLTGADFSAACGIFGCQTIYYTNLTGADFTGADTRGAGSLDLSGTTSTNLIRPDGHIGGLELAASGLLAVRDYDGYFGIEPIPITIDQHLAMAPGGTLRMVFEADAWDSTISFAPSIPVALGGTLELTFANDVNLASQVGRTFDLFDWTGVTPIGQFAISSPYMWDTSNIYTTGEVTLTAVPEAASWSAMLVCSFCLTFHRRRKTS